MKYRSDIDGLRALAVVAVLLYHGGAKEVFPGGYVGVDIFFVISGFVIASTLYEDLKMGRFSIWRFYSKRVRRIFPALFTSILISLIIGWLLLLPSFYRSFFSTVWSTAIFVSNIYLWRSSGYFTAAAISQPLLHTWTLAVEEQYYLIFPVLIWGVYRYFRRKWIIVFIPVIILSLAASCYATIIAPTANFFLLPTRAWEFLIGALLALNPPPKLSYKKANEALALFGLGLIAYAVFALSEQSAFPGYNALYPCLGAAILIYTNTGSLTATGKMLSLRPAVGIGKISYSLYLVHWPVIVFFYFITLSSPGLKQFLPLAGLSIFLAALSWKYVEQPFRHLEGKLMQRRLLLGGAVSICFFFLCGWVGANFDGFPSRFPNFKTQKIESKELWNNGVCFFEGQPDPTKWDYEKCMIVNNKGEKALLWGDSFAAQYVPGIKQYSKNIPYTIIEYTAAGCPPVLSYRSYARQWCSEFNARALDIIRKYKIKTVIISALWTDMQSRGLDQIQSTLKELDKMGVQTFVIGQSPQFSIDVQVLGFHQAGSSGSSIDKWNIFFDPKINEQLKDSVGNHNFVDPLTFLCQDTLCPYREHGVYLYADYGHFSAQGSALAVKTYFPLFEGE